MRVARNGASAPELVTNTTQPYAIALDTDYVYRVASTEPSPLAIINNRLRKGSATTAMELVYQALSFAGSSFEIAVDSGVLYAGTPGGFLYAIPAGGGAVVPAIETSLLTSFAVDANHEFIFYVVEAFLSTFGTTGTTAVNWAAVRS